jgi:hypothetical protein
MTKNGWWSLPPRHLPRVAQKLTCFHLHVLDYQSFQARLARWKTPDPALFIMHKGAQACISAGVSVPQGAKTQRN